QREERQKVDRTPRAPRPDGVDKERDARHPDGERGKGESGVNLDRRRGSKERRERHRPRPCQPGSDRANRGVCSSGPAPAPSRAKTARSIAADTKNLPAATASTSGSPRTT